MHELRRVIGGGQVGLQAGLHRIAEFGLRRRQADDVEAETRIAGVADGDESFGEQRADAVRIAQRRAGPGLDPKHLAVGAEQRDLQLAGAFLPPFQQPCELLRQMLDCAEHVGLEQDRIGEAAFRHIGRQLAGAA